MKILIRNTIIPVSIILLMGISSLEARPHRVNQIPNGSTAGCFNCHLNPAGGGARNSFGSLVESSFLVGGDVNWVADLASADSDGDGFSNGHELEDPFGMWSTGTANPGNSAFVTNPGVNTDVPTGEAAKFSLLMTIGGMAPHSGQLFMLQIIDIATSTLVVSEELASIVSSDFDYMFMHVLEAGASYNIDMWADHNGNGSYDAPPTDHAWRVELNNVTDNISQDFQHSTNFTDIGGPVSIDSEIPLPQIFTLYDNYPNPFNPQTAIRFELATAGHVNLDIFNIRGELVAQLIAGEMAAGSHSAKWSATNNVGKDLPAGIYIYTLRSGGQAQSKRMMLLK